MNEKWDTFPSETLLPFLQSSSFSSSSDVLEQSMLFSFFVSFLDWWYIDYLSINAYFQSGQNLLQGLKFIPVETSLLLSHANWLRSSFPLERPVLFVLVQNQNTSTLLLAYWNRVEIPDQADPENQPWSERLTGARYETLAVYAGILGFLDWIRRLGGRLPH